jgi:hypothetical protein
VTGALDAFSLAEQVARTKEEKLFSLTNLLFCLEFLDMERSNIEEQIKNTLMHIDDSKAVHFKEQFLAYQLRKEFYSSGNIKKTSLGDKVGQAQFFSCYTSHLPYTPCSSELKNSLSEKGYLWRGSYRLRTLNNIFLLSDQQNVSIGDAIDRLYLWTWQWMKGSDDVSLKKLELTLASIINILDIDLICKENQLLLRNTLGWIQLCCPKLVSGLKKSIDVLESMTSKNYGFLDQEFFLIQKIKTRVYCGKESNIKLIKPFTHFYEDLEELPRLCEVINPIIDRKSKKSFDLIIDFATNDINNNRLSLTVTSPMLSRFFYMAFEKGQFSPDDIKDGFGKSTRQVYNLFARARKFMPSLSVELKDGVIMASLKRDKLLLINEQLAEKPSLKPIKHKHYKASKTDMIASPTAIRLIYPNGFKRVDFEKTFELSKATATRVINRWTQEGIILKSGQGKGVIYKWND